jgi:hypothetical protein
MADSLHYEPKVYIKGYETAKKVYIDAKKVCIVAKKFTFLQKKFAKCFHHLSKVDRNDY